LQFSAFGLAATTLSDHFRATQQTCGSEGMHLPPDVVIEVFDDAGIELVISLAGHKPNGWPRGSVCCTVGGGSAWHVSS
jgi:hypothetical protein